MKVKYIERVAIVFLATLMALGSLGLYLEKPASADDGLTLKIGAVTDNSVKLSWTCKVPGAATIKVARNPNNKLLYSGNVSDGVKSVKDVNLSKAIKCTYRVSVYDKKGKRIATDVQQATTTGVGNVGGITVYPGYKSITLKWRNVRGASYYLIDQWDASTNKKITGIKVKASNKEFAAYRDKRANKANVNYAYSIWAVREYTDSKGKKVVSKSAARATTPNVKCVRQMYQTIWLKSSVTLSAHAGGSGSRTFGSGQGIVTTGFGGGKFKFWYGGKLYYCDWTRVRKAKADYSRDLVYARQAGMNFVNEAMAAGEFSKSSKSPYVIWVSTYTQHLYIFRWSVKNKRWEYFQPTVGGKKKYSDWEVATGAAGSPTPIGFTKRIHNKIRSRHDLPYWSCFQTINSFHGKQSSWPIDGKPHSTGCVRNYNENAQWIYQNCPIGTPVIIY